MIGFWESERFGNFDDTVRKGIVVLNGIGHPIIDQRVLFDLTAYDVQSRDMLDKLTSIGADPAVGYRKTAAILSSGLLKMQARRIAPGYKLFSEEGAAMAWLLDDEDES